MNYRVEWIGGVVVYGIVLLLLIVPELAVIAVLVVALAALVALVALAATALVSPYLLVRGVRRRRAQQTTRGKNRMDPFAERDPRRGPVVAPTDRPPGTRASIGWGSSGTHGGPA